MRTLTFILCTLLSLKIFSQNKIEKFLDSLDTEIIKSSTYAHKKQYEINHKKRIWKQPHFFKINILFANVYSSNIASIKPILPNIT